jgi:ribonuclease-3
MSKALENLYGIIPQLEEKINYTFTNKDNIILALTHSSFANENRNEGLQSNERLEFLGDSVLNIVTSENIYNIYTNLAEGELTKLRASLVCEASLVNFANSINLGQYLLLGKGEELTGGRNRTSILSDAFEAVIGAIYNDGGIDSARKFINRYMEPIFKSGVKCGSFIDFKTQLQEIVQKHGEKKIIYEITDQKGPDHNKVFEIQVRIGNEVMGKGKGKSKKEAEQNAAESAVKKYTGKQA